MIQPQTASELLELSSIVRPGPAVRLGGLTVVPIFGQVRIPAVDLLDESVAEGRTQVTEVCESGAVPVVKVKHDGPHTLLLLDGEILVGAKQNRVLNASFLVPAGATLDAPVSCVERGRWHYQEARFHASPTTMGSKMRASKLRRVVGSIRGGRGYDADQSAVWREVDDHLHRTGTASPTSSYTDSHTLREREIESRLPEIEPRDGQIGIAALHGDVLVGLDVFGSTAVFKRAWARLARGILGDVLEDEKANTRDAEGAVRAILASLGDAQLVRTPAARGATLHGSLGRHAVGAVVDGGRVFHVTVG